MAALPKEFTDQTRRLMGDERFERYLQSFDEEPPVSIRLNPQKVGGWTVPGADPVPWCRHGYYLSQRPQFTLDPLLHAGCYYVQEAASMFLDEVLRQIVNDEWSKSQLSNSKLSNCKCLDLCAAPGGKSTLLRAALPADWVLYSNEPIRQRANILSENVYKWGYPNHIVTNNYPRDFSTSHHLTPLPSGGVGGGSAGSFDLILCDVPCSGEGMFRKDPATIREWSPQNVERCWHLQREIIRDIWPCLPVGGILIYSTCTFNTKENEENIRWLLSEYDAEVLSVATRPEWNITGSLLDGFVLPVYRFIPGISRGEGLFICAVRKMGNEKLEMGNGNEEMRNERRQSKAKSMNGTAHSSFLTPHSSFNVPLSYQEAIAYLRGEALRLPDDTPRGELTVTFMGHPLGQVKNIGTRANNLYPKEWRIRTTHVPDTYSPVIVLR